MNILADARSRQVPHSDESDVVGTSKSRRRDQMDLCQGRGSNPGPFAPQAETLSLRHCGTVRILEPDSPRNSPLTSADAAKIASPIGVMLSILK